MGLKITFRGNLEEKLKEKSVDIINEKLAEVLSEVVPLTPVSKSIHGRTERNRLVRAGLAEVKKGHTGGNLRKHWSTIPARFEGSKVIGYLYNDVHYAPHVNFGHRTRWGMKKEAYTPEGLATNKKRYVPGRHFLEQALQRCGFYIKNNKGGRLF